MFGLVYVEISNKILVKKEEFGRLFLQTSKVKIVDLKKVIEDAFVCCVTPLNVKVLFKLLFFKLVSDCLMSIERVLTNLTTKKRSEMEISVLIFSLPLFFYLALCCLCHTFLN